MIKGKIFTITISITSGILLIITIFFPIVSTLFSGENHKYYLDGTIFIIENSGTTRYSTLIPGEYVSILFTITFIIYWIVAIMLLINAILIGILFFKKRKTNVFSILCVIIGSLNLIILIIIYFTFPFVGAGITLSPDVGFILSLISGISAIGAGIPDIIIEKHKSIF